MAFLDSIYAGWFPSVLEQETWFISGTGLNSWLLFSNMSTPEFIYELTVYKTVLKADTYKLPLEAGHAVIVSLSQQTTNKSTNLKNNHHESTDQNPRPRTVTHRNFHQYICTGISNSHCIGNHSNPDRNQ